MNDFKKFIEHTDKITTSSNIIMRRLLRTFGTRDKEPMMQFSTPKTRIMLYSMVPSRTKIYKWGRGHLEDFY